MHKPLGVHNVSPTTLGLLTDSQVEGLRAEWAEAGRRFWSKVRILDSDKACWIWTAGRMSNGRYGQFSWSARFGRTTPVGAHRVAWELANGREMQPGEHILHSCDTPLCVNPKHLSVGTPTDNMRDASAKGRLAVPRRRTRGFKDEVIARYLAGDGTMDELAAQYGIHKMTVQRWTAGLHEPYARPHRQPVERKGVA